MNAFVSLENYIVKQELNAGVGVSVTLDEAVAKYESTRRKGVLSYNNWLLVNIPGENFFIDMTKPIKEQSDDVLASLMKNDFIMSLFIYEARKIFESMNTLPDEQNNKEEYNKRMENFSKKKYEFLLSFKSGLDLFNFINSKCITHDRAKSSSLLYDFGIKGALYDDETGKRFLLFNAKKDIEPVDYRTGILEDSTLVL
ncbi:hypothetical protein [Treponema peruense]|mgnify:CR=1 FL=1|uniref:Uncharacterized protein n=1 Tax=Treponema peruense TaxID=2787628 RepID=A0A7T3REM3_9SPIR|nr:hypothetical protein [Treponema peruense]QQA01709.1 hypothetical protein IWA51_03600 [Treponema peruense]